MSRTQTQGIEYFPMAVDFFSDTKVKILKARFGADGVAIYLYILCQLYREGYYTRADDDFVCVASTDLGMTVEKVNLVLNFLLERSMFDKQLFMADKVLTGPGIQERWQTAVSVRAAKTPMRVDARYWLLDGESTRPFIKVTHFQDSSEKKAFSSEKKGDSSEKNDTKESKGKDSNKFPPLSPQGGGGESSKEKFFSLYPKLKTNKRISDGHVDYSVLIERFAKSKHLQGLYSMKVVLDKYEAIAKGEFDDEKMATRPDYRTEAAIAADERGERERYYAILRQRAEARADEMRRRAMQDKEFSIADTLCRKGEIELAKAEIYAPESVAGIQARLKRAQADRQAALIRLGISEIDLTEQAICKKCSDTGWLPNGQACDCYKESKR